MWKRSYSYIGRRMLLIPRPGRTTQEVVLGEYPASLGGKTGTLNKKEHIFLSYE